MGRSMEFWWQKTKHERLSWLRKFTKEFTAIPSRTVDHSKSCFCMTVLFCTCMLTSSKILTANKDMVARSLHDTLSECMTLWTWDSKNFAGVGFCDQAVWSRKSRRGRENARIVSRASGSHVEVEDQKWPKDMAFGFKISLEELEGDSNGSKVIVRWLQGHNSVLFESFCGMMKRKLSRLTKALDQD